MKFAALLQYTPDKDKISQARPAHRQYLTGLLHEGKLALAGPLTDDSGAIIVYECDSEADAEAILKADPFHAAGVFVSWKFLPWKVVFSNHSLLQVMPS